MTPEQVAASYDRIADRWHDLSTYGSRRRADVFVRHVLGVEPRGK